MKTIQNTFKELLRYPSAILGLVIILALIGLSVYAMVTIPYHEALRLWRGGQDVWYKNPKYAAPEWTNAFRRSKLPATLALSSKDGTASKTTTPSAEGMSTLAITYTFDYLYDSFPQEMTIYFTPKYTTKQPYASISWVTPDGREIRIADFAVEQGEAYPFSQDTKLQRRLAGLSPQQGLFVADPKAGLTAPVEGTYQLRISAFTFEEGSDLDAEFVLYGKVSGLAGTDHLRRDLMVALLWGTPVALAFGLLAALGTTITTLVIAAFGVWFGGWVDAIIQRITEINLVLPFLPILIMVGTFYSHSIWVILGVTILLSIFGATIKTYRAVFLQVKESPYIEAARAYGAGNWRIIFSYLTPRIIPMLIPQLVVLIPTFVFLEASLAVLGLGDPVLPTWGKIINDAQENSALYLGLYYWVLEPAALLVVSGLAFAMLGFSLDRIFNPRLRGL
jgi:peptide/nickel transport system permease protein